MKDEDRQELESRPCPLEGSDSCNYCVEQCPNLEEGDDESN